MFKKTLIASTLLALLSNAALAADKVRWLNDTLPTADKAVIYLAQEQGLFAEQDLEVEMAGARGGDTISQLASANADFGSANLAALLQARAVSEAPVVAVAPTHDQQPALFTTEESDIDSIQNLTGKTLAAPTHPVVGQVWSLLLQANGITPDQVSLLNMEPGAPVQMLVNDQVDATLDWMSAAPEFARALDEAGKQLKVITGFEGYGQALMASQRFLQEHPDVARRFIRVYRQAQQMATDDPQAAIAALAAHLPAAEAKQAIEQFRGSLPLMQHGSSTAAGRPLFDPERLQSTWEWLARAQGLDSSRLDPQSIIDTRYTE